MVLEHWSLRLRQIRHFITLFCCSDLTPWHNPFKITFRWTKLGHRCYGATHGIWYYMWGIAKINSHSRCIFKNKMPPFTIAQTMLTNLLPARHYASAALAVVACLSNSLSVTSQHCTKTAEHRITQTTPHDSLGILVSWHKRSTWNSEGITRIWGA